MPSTPRTVGWGIALAATTALISGVSVFVNGLIVKEFADPVVLTGARNALVGAALVAILLATGGWAEVRGLRGRSAAALLAIAAVGGSIPFILFFSGLAEASGPGAAFIHKTLFIWVAVLAVPFLGETLGMAQVIALAVLFAGVALVGPTGELATGPAELMILAATVLWAVEVILVRALLSRTSMSVRLATAARMALGAAGIAGFLAVTGRLGGVAELSATQWGLIATTGVLLLGYVTSWYAALQRAPAALVSSILVGGAVVTAVLSVVRTGTVPATEIIAGLTVLAIGVGLTVVAGRRPGAAAEASTVAAD